MKHWEWLFFEDAHPRQFGNPEIFHNTQVIRYPYYAY
jgi:hypothetical protein